MRVFISADIEGTTFTTLWDETERGKDLYPAAARQMTAEVKAACEGAIAAGADYILVNEPTMRPSIWTFPSFPNASRSSAAGAAAR
jgi:D-aminopeptidase